MKFGSIRAVGQVIATGSISSATTTILTGSGQLTNLGYATTGSNTFTGTQTMAGSIIPSVNNTYDLGSPTYQFRHVYISSGSLYVNGTKVLGSTSQELQITTDVGQSFKILESGSDTITLQSSDGNITLTSSGGGDVILDPNTGVIALKGTTTVYSGYKIVSSDGNAIQFGNGIAITGSIIATGTSLVSGSSQITFSGLSGIPSGLVSGSSQILSGTGIISSSAQESGFGYATTGSNTFQGAQTVNGSLVVTGNLTAQQYIVSSSVVYLTESFSSGSHKFGDSADDTHTFTGSLTITGSAIITGNVSTTAGFTTNSDSETQGNRGFYKFKGTTSQTAARWWTIKNDDQSFGDFAILQSAANSDATYTEKIYINPSGGVDVSGSIRVQNVITPSTGAGLEIGYAGTFANLGVTGQSQLTSYDRGGSAYKGVLINGSTHEFRISGTSALVITTGSLVGIGVTSPTALLHTKDYGTGSINTYLGTGQLRVGGGSDHGSNTILSIAPGVVKVDAPGVSGGRLTLDNSGNLTVGGNMYASTTFQNQFHYFYSFAGSGTQKIATIGSNSATNGGYIKFINDGSAGGARGVRLGVHGNGTSPDAGTDILTISDAGRVGIGNTSPSALFQVNTSDNGFISSFGGASGYVLIYAGANAPDYQASDDGAVLNIGTRGGSPYKSISAKGSAYFATSGGSVGIGTSSPGYTLDVNGNAQFSVSTYQKIQTYYSSPYTSGFKFSDLYGSITYDAGGDLMNINAYKYITFSKTSGGQAELMRVDYKGILNVGGVTHQYYAGSVSGTGTLTFTISCQTQSVFRITCMMNHYGYLNSYGCAKMSLIANGPTFDEVVISNTTSANGGSWSIARVDSTTFTITKNAGVYGGGGNYMVEVVGNNSY